MKKSRVVVTGFGMVTPLGASSQTTFNRMLNSEIGIKKANFDLAHIPQGFPSMIGKIDFENEELVSELSKKFDAKLLRKLERFALLSILAAHEAITASNLSKINLKRACVFLGNSLGGINTWQLQTRQFEAKGKCSPLTMTKIYQNMAAAGIAIAFGCKGANLTISNACASGTSAIGMALQSICSGSAKIVITGGSESVNQAKIVGAFHAIKALSTQNDPDLASRPFDIDRDGFVISEGAGMLVLEELEHAIARGAKILGEIVGYGESCDAFHLVQPDTLAKATAMRSALKDAGKSPNSIDIINAHATSTSVGDAEEISSIAKIFGKRKRDLYIVSNKGQLGHLLAASGAVEAILTIMMLNYQIILPMPTLAHLDQKLINDHFVFSKEPILAGSQLKAAISNSSGFGGINSSIVIKSYNE